MTYSKEYYVVKIGITITLFFASLHDHHRPNLCSCPRAAIKWLPLSVKRKSLTNPVAEMLNNGISLRYFSAHFHKRMKPSLEPVATKSLLDKAATAVIHLGVEVVLLSASWALRTIAIGLFFILLHKQTEPSSEPDMK